MAVALLPRSPGAPLPLHDAPQVTSLSHPDDAGTPPPTRHRFLPTPRNILCSPRFCGAHALWSNPACCANFKFRASSPARFSAFDRGRYGGKRCWEFEEKGSGARNWNSGVFLDAGLRNVRANAREQNTLAEQNDSGNEEFSKSTPSPSPSSGDKTDSEKPSPNGNSPPSSGHWWEKLFSQFNFVKLRITTVAIMQLFAILAFFHFFVARPLQNSQFRVRVVTPVVVPFSKFLSDVEENAVNTVVIDGKRLNYNLRKPKLTVYVDSLKAQLQETLPESGGVVKEEDSTEKDTSNVVDKNASREPNEQSITFYTVQPEGSAIPYDLLQKNKVVFTGVEKNNSRFPFGILETLLLIGIGVSLFLQFSNRFPVRTVGRFREKKVQDNPVLFEDVAGVDEAKEELEEIVEYLKNPERFTKLGARPPKGVLLVGPPGTGKTMLAKAVAGEADVPFISCSSSEFVELYVGVGAARVRELFARARKESPSILFIDEIDAVAKIRDGRRHMGNDEREQTLNQLLTELDGFEPNTAVIVLAATNRADVLDPALRRPGRFDRIVAVEPPDRQGRKEIFLSHIKKKDIPLDPDVRVDDFAAATTGLTGADIANLVNEAALLAGRAGKSSVGKDMFMLAIERCIAGIEKKRSVLGPSEKGVVARHEVGHALLGSAVRLLLPSSARVEKLSIMPRTGGSLGFTYVPPSEEERQLLFVDELRGRLVILLGGRAAEEIVYAGRVSTGALDDIRRATDLAYKAIAEFGLSSSIGPLSLATLSGAGLDETGSGVAVPWGKDQGQVTEMVQLEVRNLLQLSLQAARSVIELNRELLEDIGALLEVEGKIEGQMLHRLLDQVRVSPELTEFLKGGRTVPLLSSSSSASLNNSETPHDDSILNLDKTGLDYRTSPSPSPSFES